MKWDANYIDKMAKRINLIRREDKQKWTVDQKDAEPFLFVQHSFLFFWKDAEQTIKDAEHNRSKGIREWHSDSYHVHHCTMGKLQWGDQIRNFSLLREIMTILRENVTFTL